MQEIIIETKICKCGIHFEITDKDLEFYVKISPVFNGEKFLIPSPTLCSYCRQQRRFSFRNERNLYRRKCDFSGKDIISIYSPGKNYIIFDSKDWWSDKWNPFDYGRDFNFSKSFFEQFDKLLHEVPLLHSTSIGNENSDYAWSFNSKNCYLFFVGADCEDCYFSEWLMNCKYCIDCADSEDCQGCFNCIDGHGCFNCKNLIRGNDCIDCSYSYQLDNCTDCVLCHNLKNKKFCIKNIQYSEEEYKKNILKIDSNKEFLKIYSETIVKNLSLINCENCVGDLLTNCKNIYNGFWGFNSHDCKYCDANVNNSYVYDGASGNTELSLEIGSGSKIYNSSFCYELIGNNKYLLYSAFCDNSQNLFGCIGLRNSQYCILNKQYTKDEYEVLVPKIINHMKTYKEYGEFFPSSISPFGYNETVAQEYYPLTQEQIQQKNYKYSTYQNPLPIVDKIIPASKLPENIVDIPDDILNWAIECEITNKPFRIISQELEFYRKHNLPIPRRHPDQRHLDRMKLRNPRKLYERNCQNSNCNKPIKTTYSPERNEIVYCEECYNREVI